MSSQQRRMIQARDLITPKRYKEARAILNSVLLAFLSVPFLVLLPIALWLRPFADDFCTMAIRASSGIVQGSISWYSQWSGRFSATFLELLLNGYSPLLPAVLLIVWAIALYSLLRRWQTAPAATLSAALIILATIAAAPAIYESFLWTQGTTTYLAVIVAYTAALALLPRSTTLATFVAFFAAGFSDLGAMLAVFALGCLLLATRDRRIALLLGASALGLLVVLLAPGNAVRRDQFPPSNIMWAIQSALFTFSWIFKTSWLLLIVVAIGAYAYGTNAPRRLPRWLLFAPPAGLCGAFLCWLSGLYFTSWPLVERAWIIPLYLMLICTAVGAYAAGSYRRRKWRSIVPLAVCVGVIWTVALVRFASVASDVHAYAAVYDSGHMLDNAEAWIVGCAKPFYP